MILQYFSKHTHEHEIWINLLLVHKPHFAFTTEEICPLTFGFHEKVMLCTFSGHQALKGYLKLCV